MVDYFCRKKTIKHHIMKNGNLYKLAALLMAMVLLSAISFAQENKKDKEIKKKKTMYITMTVDEDGETTKVDTIVFGSPEIDIDEIMKDIDIQMEVNHEKMKEIHMQVEAEMDELSNTFSFEFEEHKDELKKAMEELKIELNNLDMEEEVEMRIQEAMEKLEKAGKLSQTHMKRFIIDESHPVFFGEDGKYEVITNEDGENIETKVIWTHTDDENKPKELKVWVDADGEEKIIIKSDGKVTEKENMFIIKSDDSDGKKVIIDMEGTDMAMFSPTKEKDIEKAIAAGLPLDQDKMFEDMDISIEIKDDEDPIIKIKTEVDGKLKATVYDQDFKKVKKLKVTEEDDKNAIHLDVKELKDSEAAYILLEQGGKTDLMRIHR